MCVFVCDKEAVCVCPHVCVYDRKEIFPQLYWHHSSIHRTVGGGPLKGNSLPAFTCVYVCVLKTTGSPILTCSSLTRKPPLFSARSLKCCRTAYGCVCVCVQRLVKCFQGQKQQMWTEMCVCVWIMYVAWTEICFVGGSPPFRGIKTSVNHLIRQRFTVSWGEECKSVIELTESHLYVNVCLREWPTGCCSSSCRSLSVADTQTFTLSRGIYAEVIMMKTWQKWNRVPSIGWSVSCQVAILNKWKFIHKFEHGADNAKWTDGRCFVHVGQVWLFCGSYVAVDWWWPVILVCEPLYSSLATYTVTCSICVHVESNELRVFHSDVLFCKENGTEKQSLLC